MTETANDHQSGDCLVGCLHPSHDIDDAVIDLSVYLGEFAFDEPEHLEPAFL